MYVKCKDDMINYHKPYTASTILTHRNPQWVHLSTEETQHDAHQLVSRDWDSAFQAPEVQAAIEMILDIDK